ncbi:hypothetical protein D3C87_467290 [compost metagenome]
MNVARNNNIDFMILKLYVNVFVLFLNKRIMQAVKQKTVNYGFQNRQDEIKNRKNEINSKVP